jgi:hypothetical protein
MRLPRTLLLALAAAAVATAGAAVGQAPPAPIGPDGVPRAPEEGGYRHLRITGVETRLNLRERPSTAAPAVARLRPGVVLDNLGCRRAEGRVWCDVQPLGGGPRGFAAAEFLEPAPSPAGVPATGPDLSALRAGAGDFDARGEIPCAWDLGQPATRCRFAVARGGGGAATVVVTRPDGGTRVIYFANGVAIGAGTSEADPAGPFDARREADLTFVRIGRERYEIPDAAVLGG